jgi:hypothetical protein
MAPRPWRRVVRFVLSRAAVPEPVKPQTPISHVIEPWSLAEAARALTAVGVVLVAAAAVDYASALYPLALGTMEWEFGTFAELVAGLPLGAVGLAALWLAAGLAGTRRALVGVAVVLFAAAAWALLLTVLFATNIPPALAATAGVAQFGLKKLMVKTLALGLLFSAAFVLAGMTAWRHSRGTDKVEVLT